MQHPGASPPASDRDPATLLGVDLGSTHTAIVAAHHRAPVVHVPTLDCAPDESAEAYTARVVAAVALAVTESRCSRVVVEWGPFWLPPMNPYPGEPVDAFVKRKAKRDVRLQQNRDVCSAMLGGILAECARMNVPITKIAAVRWRSCIGANTSAIPKERRNRTTVDAMVKAALERHLGPRAAVLRDVHQRDAFGAVLGHLLTPEKPVKEKVPRQSRRGIPLGPDTGTLARLEAVVELLRARGDMVLSDMATELGITKHNLGMFMLRTAIPSGRVTRSDRGRWSRYSLPQPTPPPTS